MYLEPYHDSVLSDICRASMPAVAAELEPCCLLELCIASRLDQGMDAEGNVAASWPFSSGLVIVCLADHGSRTVVQGYSGVAVCLSACLQRKRYVTCNILVRGT